MALTTLDLKTALVVIDLQKGIIALPTVHPAGEVVQHARALVEAFRRQCRNLDAADRPGLDRPHSADSSQCHRCWLGHGAPVRTPGSFAGVDWFCGRSSRPAKTLARHPGGHGSISAAWASPAHYMPAIGVAPNEEYY
jgi:hypothetical protein